VVAHVDGFPVHHRRRVFTAILAHRLMKMLHHRFAVGERKVVDAAGVVVGVDVVELLPFQEFLHVGAVLPEPAGRIGPRPLLFVHAPVKVVEMVEQPLHLRIVILADLVAETVGADGRVRIGVPNPLLRLFHELRPQIAPRIGSPVESLDIDLVGAFRRFDPDRGIGELVGDDDAEFVEHVVKPARKGFGMDADVVDIRIFAQKLPVAAADVIDIEPEGVHPAVAEELVEGMPVMSQSAQHDRLAVEDEIPVLHAETPHAETLYPGDFAAGVAYPDAVEEGRFTAPQPGVVDPAGAGNHPYTVFAMRIPERKRRNFFAGIPLEDFAGPAVFIGLAVRTGNDAVEENVFEILLRRHQDIRRPGGGTDVQIDQPEDSRLGGPSPAHGFSAAEEPQGDVVLLPRPQRIGDVETLRRTGAQVTVGRIARRALPYFAPVHIEREVPAHFVEGQDGALAAAEFRRGEIAAEIGDTAPFPDLTRNRLLHFRPAGFLGNPDQEGNVDVVGNQILRPAGVVEVGGLKIPLSSAVVGIVLPVVRHLVELPPAGERNPLQIRKIDIRLRSIRNIGRRVGNRGKQRRQHQRRRQRNQNCFHSRMTPPVICRTTTSPVCNRSDWSPACQHNSCFERGRRRRKHWSPNIRDDARRRRWNTRRCSI